MTHAMTAPPPFFNLISQDGNARHGMLNTAHGCIDTPCFMPVGTQASVKAMRPADLLATKTQIILANCYHLLLRPGRQVIKAHGGLHAFMHWHQPILTDSGGFQIWSLAQRRHIDDDGVTFRSHIDGTPIRLTPQSVIEAQYDYQSTITMPLDECLPADADSDAIKKSVERSCHWAAISKQHFQKRDGYALFAIQQGCLDEQQRRLCADQLTRLHVDGYAIGGLSVGESRQQRNAILAVSVPLLPSDKPRYLMGVGRPIDIIDAVENGIDMFDCVLPTRCGRTAKAFTFTGEINLMNAQHRYEQAPLDATCPCSTCRQHSRSYLHHLCKSKDILASMLITFHNIHFYQHLMQKLRDAIARNTFATTATALRQQLATKTPQNKTPST